ncbi:MAG: alpha/beta hydrolase [Actinomycetota bacterium]|nr:MAG: alpha/beta hydrolase [Actinomycetota bacterium]
MVDLGYDDVGTGPAVVLLPAFPFPRQIWQAQRDALAQQGWRVLTVDLRGFGESALGDDEPALPYLAGDVLALLERLRIDRCVLGGVSMGGYVAMAMLRQAPEVVAGLLLVDTKATADSPDAAAVRRQEADAVDGSRSTQLLAQSLPSRLLGPVTRSQRPELVDQVRDWIAAASPAAVAWAQRAMATRPDSLDVLAALGVPALVLWGEDDVVSPQAEQAAMLGVLSRGTAVALPGVGHLSPLEAPEAVTAAIAGFIGPLRPPYV